MNLFFDTSALIKAFHIEALNSITVTEAENLFAQYYSYGLRTLDALQFASFTLLSNKNISFVSSDNKLCEIVQLSGNKAINPIFYNFPK